MTNMAGPLMAVFLLLVAGQASAVTVLSDSPLPPELRCPDGRIPLNSPQERCRSLPQLQWAGRRCLNDSEDFRCPSGFDCLAEGICCDSPEKFRFDADLCRLRAVGSKAVDTIGTCAADDDCKTYESRSSQCCSGTCVLLMQRCFRQRSQYLSILSTGQVPRIYMPSCTEDGAFAPIQWEPRFNQRWCVDQRTGLAQRTGCCLPAPGASSTCSTPRPCPTDLCALSVCPAMPDALCRVNPCGADCSVEFVDLASGRPVNCNAGISRCQAGEAAYFDGLKYLRARDQTQWLQTDTINNPVNPDRATAAFMDTCQTDVCQAYNASKMEPAVQSLYGSNSWGYQQNCPKQNRLNYQCRNRCNGFAGCPSGRQVCCNSGCGLECMTPADIKPEAQCAMSISSGHCPAVGCYRMCRRWGYDTARKVCRPFWYAGSGGNNNRYNSWAECEWAVQNCHGRVLIALPVRPSCQSSGVFNNVQASDNGIFWCVKQDGTPTPGTLHADKIRCTVDGQLVINKYYKKVAILYKGRCANGAWPAWCHHLTVDRTCGSPGVTTFADACNNCRLVHINADGEEVACQTDAAVCAASTIAVAAGPAIVACQFARTAPNFRYSSGSGVCSAGCPISGVGGYTREAGCLSACAQGWCGRNATAFNPDLCVSPTCPRWPKALCVPDECSGSERYFLPNGTEVLECARRLAPLQPADCGSNSTVTRMAATTTIAPGGSAGAASTTTKSGGSAGAASTTTRSGGSAGAASTTTKSGESAGAASTITVSGGAVSSTGAPATMPLMTTRPIKPAAPKTILPICRIRFQLSLETMRCRSTDGRYEPRQCNLTHCFCVTVDSGVILQQPEPVLLAKGSELACPIVETTNMSLTITYDTDYMLVLPTMQDEEKLQTVIESRYAYEGGLQARHIRAVDLEPGSILVTVDMQKAPGDSTADLPASAFELKTMALKQTLTLDFNGVTLTPSARQSFNENSGSSVVQPPVEAALAAGVTDGTDASSSQLNVVGIVAGVCITVIVVAVSGVLIAFVLRRRTQGRAALPHETGNYETMSNASQSSGYDNFLNKVYGPVEEDVYDNIAQPSSNA